MKGWEDRRMEERGERKGWMNKLIKAIQLLSQLPNTFLPRVQENHREELSQSRSGYLILYGKKAKRSSYPSRKSLSDGTESKIWC